MAIKRSHVESVWHERHGVVFVSRNRVTSEWDEHTCPKQAKMEETSLYLQPITPPTDQPTRSVGGAHWSFGGCPIDFCPYCGERLPAPVEQVS
jgi:hypothetical protein